MAKITGVVFKEGGKVYYFAPGKDRYKEGMGVIVETSRGVEYATVVIPFAEVEDSKLVSPLKPIMRIASAKDKEIHRKNLEKKDEALKIVAEKIEKHNLDMKLIDCEFTFDGAKAVFYYSAPQRVDFRELVKELSQVFKMRIELRQVGIRDEIKMIGGLAPCGRECCCASCMPEFKKVSIKMAKNQGLSLNPGKISGLCGRLMCCLSYENDYYAEACKKMPKIGSEVTTPDGKGTVVNVNMLKMEVRVRIDDKEKDIFTYHDFPVSALKFKTPHRSEKEEKDEEVPADLKEILD
ncbi:MAG: stage 0 sporulation family protein [Clostridiales bacterium]|nr:stage 0 sporulation family protein [Clostridiales bacterium]